MEKLGKNSSFWWLSGSQFLGAFNDNIFKQFILILAIKIQVDWLPGDAQATAFAIFALPFILFAILGGSLADRFSKRQVIVAMNIAEIGIMILGAVAFALDVISVDWAIVGAMAVLFLMGTQSALFGPSKYGIIPELVDEKQMTRANGIVNMLTNVAIILGTLFATYLYEFLHPVEGPGHPNWWSGFFFVTIATCGWLLSRRIKRGNPADPGRRLVANPAVGFSEIRHVAKDRPLFAAVLANSWFYFVGALAMMALNSYGEHILGLTAGGELFFFVAIGIAAGSLLASRLSGEFIELGLVPLGALGMGIGFAALYWLPIEPIWLINLLLAFAGLSGGIYLVPLAAYIQQRPPAKEKGRVLGAQELLNFLLIFLAAGTYALMVSETFFAFDERQVLLALGALAFFGAIGTFLTAPHTAIRFPLWLLTHTIYRIKVLHQERIPRRGGALIVANHISYADPFLVGASLPRYVRFLMHRSFTKVPLVGPFSKVMRAIPVSDADGPRALVKSLEVAAEHARNGELVCIFAEGGISRTGNLLPFSKGLEMVARAGDIPIIPMYLDRVWGSIFSFKGKRFFFKRPLKFPYPITAVIGKPLPSDATAFQVRQAVQELSAEALDDRQEFGTTLPTRFIEIAKSSPRKLAMAESSGKELSYRKLLIAVLILRSKLRDRLEGQKYVGVMLPAGIAGGVTNLALAMMGKVAVNLNFTAGKESFGSAIEQTGLKSIITAALFTDKAKLDLDDLAPGTTVIDIARILQKEVQTSDRIVGLLKSFLPKFILKRLQGIPQDPQDEVAVIFSSGSTGLPKGARLTHHNILSNVRSLGQVFHVMRNDRVLGALPFFHVFGYTVTLWFPMALRMTAIYHPVPTDAGILAEMVEKYRATIFLSTPTFYRTYLRKFTREGFSTVRIAAAGAEKLKVSLANQWREKFGTDLLEGYGCTELSPVVSVNLPDVRDRGVRQKAMKQGTIGQPLPGIVPRIVDPDTMQDLPPGEDGLLLVKGPNVMVGYLGREDLTSDAIRDGWYVTGDIAHLDRAGFLTITDRLSRFSKLGGEMVPHVRVEEALQEVVDSHCSDDADEDSGGPQVAVTSVPDEAKGERLAVLHTTLPISPKDLISEVRGSGIPNLWIPRADAFLEVEEVPRLGSGKLDLKQIKLIACEKLGVKAE